MVDTTFFKLLHVYIYYCTDTAVSAFTPVMFLFFNHFFVFQMASSTLSTTPSKRVFLWGIPRSLSTAFLRGLSNVDDFQVWCEPYLSLKKMDFSWEKDLDISTVPKHFYSMKADYNTFDWVKQQLERDYPGKRVVFVKEMVEGIHGHYDELPRGYLHTFLIRHPLKVFTSLKKLFKQKLNESNLEKLLNGGVIPSGFYYKEMVKLLDHVKKFYDPNPLIIDADDLQSNPEAVMKEFCSRVGVSYDERTVKWDGDVTFDNWMVAKELTPIFTMPDIHKKATTGSTGFSKLTDLPSRSDLSDDVLKLADYSMEYYEILYAQKLVV